jgi:hypothetical protein
MLSSFSSVVVVVAVLDTLAVAAAADLLQVQELSE